jgi:hypothetical protein
MCCLNSPMADLYDCERDIRRLRNLLRRVSRARDFPTNTCSASRHLHMIATRLAQGKPYPMLEEEPQHCAETMLAVLESLWKLRTKYGHG